MPANIDDDGHIWGETKEELMENIKEKVFQAIGHASVCWKDGVFDSKEAEKIGNDLLIIIKRELSRWIPVGERLPEIRGAIDKEFLVSYKGGGMGIEYSTVFKSYNVTHWQEKPEPPKE